MSNNPLVYTLISEGFAEYEFIPAYIKWVASNVANLTVHRTNIQIPISKNSSSSKVLATVSLACAKAFGDERKPSHLFIAGVDLDAPDVTDDLDKHVAQITKIRLHMGDVYKKYEDKIVLYVPIQAVDYWLRYVQKPVSANSLESVSKDETKRVVYGTSRPDRRRIEQVARERAQRADFAMLARQSKSFNHFHKQVVLFLTRYVPA